MWEEKIKRYFNIYVFIVETKSNFESTISIEQEARIEGPRKLQYLCVIQIYIDLNMPNN